MLIIKNIKLNVDENESTILSKVIKKYRLNQNDIKSYEIYSKSLDARKDPIYIYSVLIETKNEARLLKYKDVSKYIPYDFTCIKRNDIKPVIIVGYGPSAIFCALRLKDAGIKSIVFERGSCIEKRRKDVENFFNGLDFNPNSNVQYGEGGAGTFSDAKLTTRIKNPYIEYILNTFIKHGADQKIKYESHPHIGTDRIQEIIAKITKELTDFGSLVNFDEEVKEVLIEDNKVIGVKTSKDSYYSDRVVLAMGHSPYEFFKMLDKNGVYLESKDFSIGFRVEHPQTLIDINQYGKAYDLLKDKASEYFLRAKTSLDKGVYSFCMCPGGFVIPSNSEKGTVVTNGMSYSNRDNKLANSAILVQVDKNDYGEELFSGFEYIHALEKAVYDIDNSYKAISQNIKDFMNDELNDLIFPSSYVLGTKLYPFNKILDDKLIIAFKEAFLNFDNKIPGFIDNGIIVGLETRSSCPVRILRNSDYQSVNTKGLFPIGEGAGYAGGIMSSALDGIKIADYIINN